jgi:hypothetical protein
VPFTVELWTSRLCASLIVRSVPVPLRCTLLAMKSWLPVTVSWTFVRFELSSTLK